MNVAFSLPAHRLYEWAVDIYTLIIAGSYGNVHHGFPGSGHHHAFVISTLCGRFLSGEEG